MLQENLKQMAASEESMFEGVWDFSKSDDVRKKADQAIAILKSLCERLQPRHQRRYRFRLRVLRQMYPASTAFSRPTVCPAYQ